MCRDERPSRKLRTMRRGDRPFNEVRAMCRDERPSGKLCAMCRGERSSKKFRATGRKIHSHRPGVQAPILNLVSLFRAFLVDYNRRHTSIKLLAHKRVPLAMPPLLESNAFHYPSGFAFEGQWRGHPRSAFALH